MRVWHCRETGVTRARPPAPGDSREWEAMRPIRSRYGVALAPEGDNYPIDRMVWWEKVDAVRSQGRRYWPRPTD